MTLKNSAITVVLNGCHSTRRICTTTLVESGVRLQSGITTTIRSVVKTLTEGNNNECLVS